MKGLHLIAGNRMEILAAALAEWLRHRPDGAASDPLETDIIMVQSLGMQHWLSMAIAKQNGICANVSFPFPNALLDTLFQWMAGPAAVHGPYDTLPMAFAIMKAIPVLADTHYFAALNAYLNRDDHTLKLFQLSRKIADTLDQYLIFRPDILAGWEKQKDVPTTDPHRWQATLWKRLTSDLQSRHQADLQRQLLQRLHASPRKPDCLPSRMAVFGISHLPRFHLEVLETLALHIPVYLFLMNPCRHYWGDIFSDRRRAHIRRRRSTSDGDVAEADLHFERGNRLLASWGNQGRHFFDFIQRLEIQSVDLFDENQSRTLLGRVQQDILDLVDRDPSDPKVFPEMEDPADDKSLQLHICHSAMREIEVLYDQLLCILDKHGDIDPKDIMVLAPNISDYVPYIQAVFGGAHAKDQPLLPYSVADQSIYHENKAIKAFIQILDLRDTRFEVSQVMALLDFDCIRRRFDLNAQDIAKLETWIQTTNIRWGWDQEDRRRHHLPAYKENSWRWGLDRLLLGFAMNDEDGRLFGGLRPADAIEGVESRLLGHLITFVRSLHDNLSTLVGRATMEQWRQILTNVVDQLFAVDEAALREMQQLQDAIHQMSDAARQSAYEEEIPFEVIRYQLGDTFERRSQGIGFISGGITFCSLLPMRSIPAEVVCLLGMQHDTFPRETSEPGFNLIHLEPRAGDRSKREDDKYLFLEALISARRYFYLSFIGRSRQDNAMVPPSVVIDELTDYIHENFDIAPRTLTTVHPLQGFSPTYFKDDQKSLFSYSLENHAAARALQSPRQLKPFFPDPLTTPPDKWRQLDLGQLMAFFSHPTRFLLQERLNLILTAAKQPEEDREPFDLDPLERFLVSQQWLGDEAHQSITGHRYHAIRAAGKLPHGNMGRVVYQHVEQEVAFFAQQVKSRLPTLPSSVIPVDMVLESFRISGEIDHVYPEGRFVYRMAKCRAQDLISVFLCHLFLNLIPDYPAAPKSTLICKDQIWHFQPTEDPRRTLNRYLNLYWQGLQQPLPFFPKTALAYAMDRLKGNPPETALQAARRHWVGNDFAGGWGGESTDVYYHRCFGHDDPLNKRFEEIAIAVFEPLLASGELEPD